MLGFSRRNYAVIQEVISKSLIQTNNFEAVSKQNKTMSHRQSTSNQLWTAVRVVKQTTLFTAVTSDCLLGMTLTENELWVAD